MVNAREANQDIINLLNQAIAELEKEKGSFENLGRALNKQEQQQIEQMSKAMNHIREAQEEVYRAFGGGEKKRRAA